MYVPTRPSTKSTPIRQDNIASASVVPGFHLPVYAKAAKQRQREALNPFFTPVSVCAAERPLFDALCDDQCERIHEVQNFADTLPHLTSIALDSRRQRLPPAKDSDDAPHTFNVWTERNFRRRHRRPAAAHQIESPRQRAALESFNLGHCDAALQFLSAGAYPCYWVDNDGSQTRSNNVYSGRPGSTLYLSRKENNQLAHATNGNTMARVHSRWHETAAALTHKQLQFVQFVEQNCTLWGLCQVCSSARDATNWVTCKEHFQSTQHLKYTSKRPAEACTSAGAFHSPEIFELAAKQPPQNKSARLDKYYPLHYQTDTGRYQNAAVTGAFLVDSFAYMRTTDGSCDEYMPRMLEHLYATTGKVFMALCKGGSALASPTCGGALFLDMLTALPDNLDIVVPVICGNDLYKSKRIVEYDAAWSTAILAFTNKLREKSKQSLVMFGASSATWNYTSSLLSLIHISEPTRPY